MNTENKAGEWQERREPKKPKEKKGKKEEIRRNA